MHHRLGAALAAAFSLAGLTSCSSSSTPTPPQMVQHLYVTDRKSPTTIYVFNLPLTATSTPAVTLLTAINDGENVCFDGAGHILVAFGTAMKIGVYTLPLTATSTPAFSLTTTSTPRDCHFDSSGNLYAAESDASIIEVFKAPVTSSSTVNSTITSAPLSGPWGVWTDSSGNVFASTSLNAAVEYSAFPANAQSAAFGPKSSDQFGIALGPTGSLYVANATTGGTIDVFDPPFTNASTKNAAKTIATSLTGFVSYMSFDAAANLYVGGTDGTNFHVLVYASPYTGAPLDLNRAAAPVDGVGIGP